MSPRLGRSARRSTGDAIAMHESVAPDRWCVTKHDLKDLRSEVLKAIQSGQIASPSSTSSQSDDDSETSMDDDYYYGPSIYTVNEQYIKPVTAHAGKMSWALMRNPYGLKCDLFVSHAWQEGIFEFLSKVLSSWPLAAHRARHAWCCMLANPQNLNIGSMLQSPRSSPFALALQAASYVMVVPNRHKSVYSRLWCGYEAYVASEDAKIIRIATAPSRKPMGLALLGASLPMLLGTSLGILARVFDWEVRVEGVLVATLAALLSAFTRKRCNQAANYLGLLVCTCLEIRWSPLRRALRFQALPPPIENIAQHVTFLGFTSYFVLAESDRVRSLQIEEEGRQLRKGYQGSIRFADCTGAADRQNIWDEIGDKVDAVDHAVHVLISAGVSSPALRCAEEQGVDIQDAGHAEVAIAVVFLGPFLCLSILNPTVVILVDEQTTLSWTNTSVVLLGAFARLMFLVVMCARSLDERSFMLKVISKLMTSVGLPAVSVIAVIVHFNDHVASLVVKWVFTSFHATFVVSLLFALLGIKGTLALPGGKHLLQYFYARRLCYSGPGKSSPSLSSSNTE
ncbi:unnamed protein product [Durusdinium trenchii]|uniref:Uncharacterized protein n=1 Tax=Durusdinium trenchii TaxID=1381693 RepID=A0ABP0PXK6_9DINO